MEAVRDMVELTIVSDGVPRPLQQVPKREATLLGCSQYVCCGISAWLRNAAVHHTCQGKMSRKRWISARIRGQGGFRQGVKKA